MGGVIDPHGCYLLLRGLKTFALRVRTQNESALRIARFLEAHPGVKKVYYPFLKVTGIMQLPRNRCVAAAAW